jgi:hypothetical protein
VLPVFPHSCHRRSSKINMHRPAMHQQTFVTTIPTSTTVQAMPLNRGLVQSVRVALSCDQTAGQRDCKSTLDSNTHAAPAGCCCCLMPPCT